MEKTQGGFLLAFILGLMVGVIIAVAREEIRN